MYLPGVIFNWKNTLACDMTLFTPTIYISFSVIKTDSIPLNETFHL